MPLKTLKEDKAEELVLKWILHTREYKLSLDKNLCVGCQICSLACPKEAIRLERSQKAEGEKAEHAKIDIDLEKCNFCGICDILCPYGAIRILINGEHVLSVVEKESFPLLIRDIKVDSARCPVECVECEEACPLDLIKVTTEKTDKGKATEDKRLGDDRERSDLKVNVQIKKEYCPCCKVCEFKCPEGLVGVQKIFHGKIAINQEKCPENCTDCLDVCPITDALYLSDEDRKVYVNEAFCVYCGACKVVCPVEEAMELKRTWIKHTPVSSGAWNKALERLASPVEISKELKAKGSQKARESVKKRLGWRVA